jgi:hypothetical protein
MNVRHKTGLRVAGWASAGGLLLLLVAGVLWERQAEKRDRARYPRIGTPVDIGGRTLNLYCSGQGSPVVIFDSGGHTAGYSWIRIQPEVAKFTRACWYDRAGYGWSDPGPSPRTFAAIASDLHALAHAAGLTPPYVLVGATAATFHVRVYNALYPQDVAGAVLIHASDWDIFSHEPAYMGGALARWPAWLKGIGCKALWPGLVRVGVVRLMHNAGAGRPFGLQSLNRAQQQELIFLSNNPSTALTEGEGCTLSESMAEVRASGTFGNRPLMVLVSDEPFRAPAPAFEGPTRALNDFWFHELQPRLAGLSTVGQLAMNAHAEEPASIVAAVREVVVAVRDRGRTQE